MPGFRQPPKPGQKSQKKPSLDVHALLARTQHVVNPYNNCLCDLYDLPSEYLPSKFRKSAQEIAEAKESCTECLIFEGDKDCLCRLLRNPSYKKNYKNVRQEDLELCTRHGFVGKPRAIAGRSTTGVENNDEH